jgi:hypothetical protein
MKLLTDSFRSQSLLNHEFMITFRNTFLKIVLELIDSIFFECKCVRYFTVVFLNTFSQLAFLSF